MVEVDYGGGNLARKTGRSRTIEVVGKARVRRQEAAEHRASSGRRKETGAEEEERPNQEKSKWASDQVTWRRTRPNAHDSDTLSYSSGSSSLSCFYPSIQETRRDAFSLHSVNSAIGPI